MSSLNEKDSASEINFLTCYNPKLRWNNLSSECWQKLINHIRASLINWSTSPDRQQPTHIYITHTHTHYHYMQPPAEPNSAPNCPPWKLQPLFESRTWKQLRTLHVSLYRILIKKPCILFAVTKGNLGVHLNPIRPVLMPQEMRE